MNINMIGNIFKEFCRVSLLMTQDEQPSHEQNASLNYYSTVSDILRL